jgi:Flp pilus assembly protein TadD
MSLLNNVLRDLQSRGAFGLPPLTGLQPVADLPDQHHKRALLLPALAVLSIAAAIVVWRPIIDGRGLLSFANIMSDAATQPESIPQTDAQMSPQVEPTIAATGDDMRDILAVDSYSNEIPARRDDDVVELVADAPLASAVMVEAPLAVEKSLPAADWPMVVESLAVTQSAATKESVAATESPAVIESPGTTTISRRATDDKDTSAIVAMGLAAMRSNDLYTAERLFREALAVDSGDSAIWSYLYGVLVRASQPAAAEKALQQGLVLAKEPVALAKLYARMLLDRGDKDAAVTVLKNHRPAPASDTDYDAFLGALLQQRGQYAEAGNIYENLLTAEPNSGSAWIGLAMSHDSLGNRADAMSAFESALRTGSLKTPLARYARRRTAELAAND